MNMILNQLTCSNCVYFIDKTDEIILGPSKVDFVSLSIIKKSTMCFHKVPYLKLIKVLVLLVS